MPNFLAIGSGVSFCGGSNFALLHWLRLSPLIQCCATARLWWQNWLVVVLVRDHVTCCSYGYICHLHLLLLITRRILILSRICVTLALQLWSSLRLKKLWVNKPDWIAGATLIMFLVYISELCNNKTHSFASFHVMLLLWSYYCCIVVITSIFICFKFVQSCAVCRAEEILCCRSLYYSLFIC